MHHGLSYITYVTDSCSATFLTVTESLCCWDMVLGPQEVCSDVGETPRWGRAQSPCSPHGAVRELFGRFGKQSRLGRGVKLLA